MKNLVSFVQEHLEDDVTRLILDRAKYIKKTAFYVEAIARELLKEGKYSDVLDEKYIEKLKRSAPLHDIGKIAVSDLILNKPGKLTDDEFAIMKSHTTEGTNILAKIEANTNDTMDYNYLKESMEMAHYHHEKWDGTGYPTGIKGAFKVLPSVVTGRGNTTQSASDTA